MQHTRLYILFPVVLVVLLMTGCIGGNVPSEQILRIAQTATIKQAITKSTAPLITMDDLDSFPALDRSAVMIANRNVLTPSSRWYWEGAPANIVSASIAATLQEQEDLVVVWPARNRLEHQALLTGRVEIFEVREREAAVHMRVSMSLWTPRGKQLLLMRTAESDRPLSGMNAQAIAESAGLCLNDIAQDISVWLHAEGLAAIHAAQQ